MELDLCFLAGAVARHTPEFRLHPDEDGFPCTAEFFLRYSELQEAATRRALAKRGALASPEAASKLRRLQEQHEGTPLQLVLPPPGHPDYASARRGADDSAPDRLLADVPVYANAKAVLASSGVVEALEITYTVLYTYNGAYPLCAFQVGAHDGDVEHVTARVHPLSGDLLGMWYNSHRSRDGAWLAGPQVPISRQSGRPVAYVALHGHGQYSSPGLALRAACFANDRCSDRGRAWLPDAVLLPNLQRAPAVPLVPSTAGLRGQRRAQLSASRPEPGRGESGFGNAVRERSGAVVVPLCPSRGTPRGVLTALSPRLGGGRQARSKGAAGAGAAAPALAAAADDVVDGSIGSRQQAHRGGASVARVITDDPCAWVFFRGKWGAIDAPASQGWFHTAETPVSRTVLQRLLCQCLPETQSL